MEPRLTGIHENEVLLYLGYKGGEIPENIRADLRRCQELLLKTARPRLVWRQFRWDGDTLDPTGFRPEGEDIRELLKDCQTVILFAATLGSEVEQLLRRAQIQNMSDAVILDACASSAIENVCDNFCQDLAESVTGHLTDRFSPGYGDLPFAQQPDFCKILDVGRRIGVQLSPGGLMIPQKTVTALLGVADKPQKKRFRGCAYCGMFETCTYRKENRTCGNF